MANVHDLAAYLLKLGPMTTVKLQKLVYYTQAWTLAWTGEPAFADDIQAWSGGPVVPELFRSHRTRWNVTSWSGDAARVPAEVRKVADAVLAFYGDRDGDWLSELTHREAPWQKAREGLPQRAASNRPITLDAMRDYYGACARQIGQPFAFSGAYARGLEWLVALPEDEVEGLDVDSDVDVDDEIEFLTHGGADPWKRPDA